MGSEEENKQNKKIKGLSDEELFRRRKRLASMIHEFNLATRKSAKTEAALKFGDVFSELLSVAEFVPPEGIDFEDDETPEADKRINTLTFYLPPYGTVKIYIDPTVEAEKSDEFNIHIIVDQPSR